MAVNTAPRFYPGFRVRPELKDDWTERAACRGEDPKWWFTPTMRGLAFCQTCKVASECLDRAQTLEREGFPTPGVWGGQVFEVGR